MASTHYLMNAYVEKGDMLLNYASWGGLEAYRKGVALTNYFG